METQLRMSAEAQLKYLAEKLQCMHMWTLPQARGKSTETMLDINTGLGRVPLPIIKTEKTPHSQVMRQTTHNGLAVGGGKT